MSAVTRNSLRLYVPTAGYVVGQLLQGSTGATVALAQQGGDTIHQSDVSVTRNSAGNYTLAIKDFKGPQGRYNVSVSINTTTADYTAQVGAISYSNRTLSVDVLTFLTGVAADCSNFFTIQAF